MYQLKKGSIFDQKCDLVIIPCDDYGGMTSATKNDLVAYGLPTSIKITTPGQVDFKICPKHFTISSVIGYSASVKLSLMQMSSSNEILHNICSQIIAYCKDNALRFVNIPLLGAGAGRLSYSESFDIIRACFDKEPYIMANIFALSQNVYELLKKSDSQSELQSQTELETHPRVFISYTGYDERNKKWVRELCVKLRENGVDARCDIFHLKLGQSLPQWMTNEIDLANKVLMICDKYYLSKIDSQRGGVGWETMIIQGDMLMNQDSNKYICIMREENPELSLPSYMRTSYALSFPEDDIEEERFKELLLNIFECDITPEIGKIPQFIREKMKK